MKMPKKQILLCRSHDQMVPWRDIQHQRHRRKVNPGCNPPPFTHIPYYNQFVLEGNSER